MSFIGETKTARSGEKYIEIKGYDGSVRILQIPENMRDEESGLDLPVRFIGNHAFSSRKDIEEVVIPDSVDTVLGFAFHNCGKLKKISLTDGISEYLDGGTRQCESLCEIEVFLKRGNPYIIRRILEDNDRRLSFRLHMQDGDAMLVFPGFNYDFVENTMARTIQFAIEGTGYAYREIVKSDQIAFREYDNLFSKVSADDRATAEMIAMSRVLMPYELSDEARNTYENWLLENALTNLTSSVKLTGSSAKASSGSILGGISDKSTVSVLSEGSGSEPVIWHIDFYIKRNLISVEDAKTLAHTATDMGISEAVSMLMNYSGDVAGKNTEDDNGVTDDNMLELDF